MATLDSWSVGEHTHAGVTHPTYRKGHGPGVIVISEIPGITPKVVEFAEEVVAAGFTVVMPQLFGRPGGANGTLPVLRTLGFICVSRELSLLARGETQPVADWLRPTSSDICVRFESMFPTTPACTRMASCKLPTVFCQRERASATSCLSLADMEMLPYFWLNIWSIFCTSKAMFCA